MLFDANRIDVFCAKCNKRVPPNQIDADVTPEYKTRYRIHCHGETEERILSIPLAGVMFAGAENAGSGHSPPMTALPPEGSSCAAPGKSTSPASKAA